MGGGGGDDDDDMPIKSSTGQFNIFFYNFEDILYDHSRSTYKDTLLRKIFSFRYTDLERLELSVENFLLTMTNLRCYKYNPGFLKKLLITKFFKK
jgi:hypothetical protein